MVSSFKLSIAERIALRALSDGGFAVQLGENYRSDSTAWACFVLSGNQESSDLIIHARNRLTEDQLPNGSLAISPLHRDVCWPTSLSVLAWHHSPIHQQAKDRAIQFLLNTTGLHWEKPEGAPIGHDTAIPGWPWMQNTHSWVAPTALAMIALTAAGFINHFRLQQATTLLVNRQLPDGGWNYGNTTVFGRTLHPFPETTGMALNALANRVTREEVRPSLEYLSHEIRRLQTPLSLGWAILGLKAWHVAPAGLTDQLKHTLEREQLYGGYTTSALSLLLAAEMAAEGLESMPHG
jgi:hypothetical protein